MVSGFQMTEMALNIQSINLGVYLVRYCVLCPTNLTKKNYMCKIHTYMKFLYNN